LEQVGHGRTADIFVASDNKVLKLYKKGFPIEAIREEYEVSQYVHDLGINVPRAFEMIERDGRLGIIFERVPGTSLLHLMTRRPLRIRRFSRTLAALHHHVHVHSVADLSRNHKEILAHNIQSAPLLTDAEKSKIIHQLQGLPEDHKLCHGDYHPDNVLVTDQNNSCVIDWMTGMAGHPLGDPGNISLQLCNVNQDLRRVDACRNIAHEYLPELESTSSLRTRPEHRLPQESARRLLVHWPRR